MMQLALLGAGQLGASFAMALKDAPDTLTIHVYDPVTTHAEYLHAQGAADYVAASPEDAVREADIVVLAAPLGSYRALAQAIAPALKPGAIVTDVGSVKGGLAAMADLLPNARLVPAHPVTGSEKSGPQAAHGELFRKRLCILTPAATVDANALDIVTTLWHAVGADVIHMPTQVHDQIYAYVSHLPHFIAFVAASYLYRAAVRLNENDATLRQFLRISTSNSRMWRDIALANRELLLPVLGTYIALLEHFATELRAGEAGAEADRTAAAKTLLPRILAASLISTVSLYEQQSGTHLRPFAGGGMRDIVAPAAHTPEEDTEAISHAAAAVADHLDRIVQDFKTLEQLIGAEDADGLLRLIDGNVADATALLTARNG